MNVLLELPIARLARTPRAWIPVGVWSLFALAAALLLHSTSPAGDVSDALQAPFGAVALPLLAYAIVGATLGGDGLARSIRPLVSFGASAPKAALAEILVSVAATAIVAPIVGVLVILLAHGPADPPLARDAFATAWVAALGGATYASLFAAGASFGKRGGGRVGFLALDALFGMSHGAGGFLTPRAHLRSLLGGDPVASASNACSVGMLMLLLLAFAGLAIARARRPAP